MASLTTLGCDGFYVEEGRIPIREQSNEIIKKYLLSDTTDIHELLETCKTNIRQTNGPRKACLICNIGCHSKGQHEYWSAICVACKFNKQFVVYLEGSSLQCSLCNGSLQSLKLVLEQKFSSESLQVLRYDTEQINGSAVDSKHILKAFMICEIYFEHIQNDVSAIDKFHTAISSHKIEDITANKLLVEHGLIINFRTKKTFQKVISELQNLVATDTVYCLTSDLLCKLTERIIDPNFAPSTEDKIDLRMEAVKLVNTLEERNPVLENSARLNVITFLKSRKAFCTNRLQECDKDLSVDTRDSNLRKRFYNVVSELLILINLISKLAPDLITVYELDELIAHLSVIGQLKKNETKMRQLNERLVVLNEELESLRAEYCKTKNNTKAVSRKVDEVMTVRDEIETVQRFIQYQVSRGEAIKLSDFEALIIFLASKLDDCQNVIICEETVDQVIAVGRETIREDVAVSVLKLLSYTEEDDSFVDFCGDIFSSIPVTGMNADIVIDFAKTCKLNAEDSSGLLEFMCSVLVEIDNSRTRNRAVQVLNDFDGEISDECRAILILERYVTEENYIENIVARCHDAAMNKYPLTFTCLEILATQLLDENEHIEQVLDLLMTVIDADIQKLPQFFVEECKRFVSLPLKCCKTTNLIGFVKSLITAEYITLEDAKNLEGLIESDEPEYIGGLLSIFKSALKNGQHLPKAIVNKVRKWPQTQYFKNLLTGNTRNESHNDILNNSNKSCGERKLALGKLMLSGICNDDQNTIDILQNLIQFDVNLRDDAFSALVTLLPEDWKVRGLSIDMKTLSEYVLACSTNCIPAVATLLRKCTGVNIMDIVRHLIYRMLGNAEEEIETVSLLIEIYFPRIGKSNNALYQMPPEDCIPYILLIAYTSKNDFIRKTMLQILSNVNCDAVLAQCDPDGMMQKLKDLDSFTLHANDRHDQLTKMKPIIAEGYSITVDKIEMLISGLISPELVTYHSDILEILSEIHQYQGLSETVCSFLLSISSDSNLILWKYISEPVKSKRSIVTFVFSAKLVIQCENLPDTALSKLEDFLLDSNEDISLRIEAGKILFLQASKYYKLSYASPHKEQEILKITGLLKKVALLDNKDEWNLNAFALKSLGEDFIFQTLPESFLKEFYINLKRRLVEQSQLDLDVIGSQMNLKNTKISTNLEDEKRKMNYAFQLLDSYVHNQETQLESKNLYLMLICLNNLVLSGQGIDPYIFTEFDEDDWKKEMLCSALVAKLCKSSLHEQSIEQFALQTFRERVRSVDKFLTNPFIEHLSYTTETVLQALIDKQLPDLETVNNILLLMQCHSKAIEIVLSDSKTFLRELQAVWLAHNLILRRIEYTCENLSMLMKHMEYRVECISRALAKCEYGTLVNDLIEFFEALSRCCLTRESKPVFLASITESESCVSAWRFKLAQVIVNALVAFKFSVEIEKEVSTCKYNLLTGILTENIGKEIEVNDPAVVKSFAEKLATVLTCGWMVPSILKLLGRLDSEESLKVAQNSVTIISEFKLREYNTDNNGNTLLAIIMNDPVNVWQKKIHNLAIFCSFQGTYDKDFEMLKSELVEMNSDSKISFLQEASFSHKYKAVMAAYNNVSSLMSKNGFNSSMIRYWDRASIKEWARLIRSGATSATEEEKLAVIMRAIEITNHFAPREVQLLSVIILLNSRNNIDAGKGRLAQIKTGEGKTTIIAMIAALMALDGRKVDIVTSSPELAKPQAEQQKEFFRTFDLTVAHNCDVNENCKDTYRADILYGAAGYFQGDILRDEYSQLGTRCGRTCDVVIVDEVDSMLIDSRNHIVMLSSPMPAMEYLEPLVAAIWMQVEAVASCIEERAGKYYFVQYENTTDANDVTQSNVEETAYLIEGSTSDWIKKCTDLHIRKMIREVKNLADDQKKVPEDYPEIKIPNHLRELVAEVQIKKWIDSAVFAKFHCKKDKHYILQDKKIAPVDASNTGVVQANMHWNNGLQQLLQIKHGARISPESFTTNFISNVVYFKRYDILFGLTGTLGSSGAIELLNMTYKLDNVFIPPFKQAQHRELSAIVATSEGDWYMHIVQSSLSKLRNGRAVLIITKYIDEACKIEKIFLDEFEYNASKIKIYATEKHSDVVKGDLKSGEVIIATNIAGRGTDIKCSGAVNDNGGLHVCVTFLPKNLRVEQQNVGRTSRTGNRGTSQFILLEKVNKNIESLKQNRDARDKKSLELAEHEIEKVLLQDDVFVKFCTLLKKIRNMELPLNKDVRIRGIEERFGIWFKMQQENIDQGKSDQLLKSFEAFENEIISDVNSDNLIQNPYFYVISGNQSLQTKCFLTAIGEYTKAIKLDDEFAEHAYYNRGYARVAEYGGNYTKNKNEIDKAVQDFKEARKRIETRELHLHILQRASDSESISEQVLHKMTLYGAQKNAINRAIGEDVQKEIDAVEAEKLGKNKQEEIAELDKQINSLRESKEAREKGIIGQQGRNLKIELVDIEKSLPEDQNLQLYAEDIKEHKNNGGLGSFTISEVVPINWSQVIALACIGLAQLIGGAALAVFTLGAGSSIGLGLISEGVSDLITAIKDGIINRDFSWATWGIQKAISITVSIVCAGIGAIKDVCKTAFSAAKQVVSTTATIVTQTVKQGWRIACKAMGAGIARGVANTIVTELVDYGISKGLMPVIEEQILKKIKEPIQRALENNKHIRGMLEIDSSNRNQVYQARIMALAFEILLDKENHEHSLITIAKGIARGIATNKIKGLSAALQVKDAIQGLVELDEFVDKFVLTFNQKVEAMILNDKNFKAQLRVVNETESNGNEERTGTQNNVYNNIQGTINTSSIEEWGDDINLELARTTEEQVKLGSAMKTGEQLGYEMSHKVAAKMSNIVQSKLILPATHAAVNYGMGKLTAKLDEPVREAIDTFQAQRRTEFFQDGDKGNRIDKQFKRGIRDEDAVEKANCIIDALVEGSEVGLYHLGPLSEVTNKPIKILDENGNIQCIIGEDKPGEPIVAQFHKPDNVRPDGHWTMANGAEPFETSSGKNNCMFDVVAQQTGLNPEYLRQETARSMRDNLPMLANQSNDIQRLEIYREKSLMMGGADYTIAVKSRSNKKNPITYRDGTSVDDARIVNDNSQGRCGEGSSNESHVRGHAVNNEMQLNKTLTNSAQNYSHDHEITAFKNRNDQDLVTHLALSHPAAKEKFAVLNMSDTERDRLQNKEIRRIDRKYMNMSKNTDISDKKISQMKNKETSEIKAKFNNRRQTLTLKLSELNLQKDVKVKDMFKGVAISNHRNAEYVTVVLQHHKGYENVPRHPVHIQTSFLS